MIRRVLVVEDNVNNMKLVSDLLEINDFFVVKAQDGETAVKILKNMVPDLILLDLIMPGLNGFEVFKKIKADDRLKDVKIIALTASATSVDEKEIVVVGFDGYIKKPIDVKTFIRQISAYLKDV